MSSLVSNLISDPSKLRLALSISDSAIDLLVCPIETNGNPTEDASSADILISRRIELSSDNQKVLDEAIYDNPLLLEDFGKTDVLIDNRKFILVPSYMASSTDLCNAIVESFWPGEPLVNLCNDIEHTPYMLLAAVDHKLFTFIRRTLSNASVMHRILPFVNFCMEESKGNEGAKIYINLRHQSIDIVYIKNHELMKANTFAVSAISDMVYYILLMASAHDFNYDSDVVMLCGDNSVKGELIPQIDKYFRLIVRDTDILFGDETGDSPVPFELKCLCHI